VPEIEAAFRNRPPNHPIGICTVAPLWDISAVTATCTSEQPVRYPFCERYGIM